MIKLFEQYNEYNQVKEWLDEMGIKQYTINDDLTVDVDGSVILVEKSLVEIPIQFGKVMGYFTVKDNDLTSLKGCPSEVLGDFDCSFNYLTSMEYSPTIVSGHLRCSSNYLTSLKGCPISVSGINCSNNDLTTLEGAPIEVEYSFICVNNKLTTLKGCPKEVEDLYCYENKLTTLEGCPVIINREFNCNNNNITSLKGCPKEIGGLIDCEKNPLPQLVLDLIKDLGDRIYLFFNNLGDYSVWSDNGDFNVSRFNLLKQDIKNKNIT